MKSILSVALAAILMTGSAKAQNVNIGVKGGLNLFNLNVENGQEFDTKVGFHAGLLGHIHLAPQLALQPEVVYSSQGGKYDVTGGEYKLNLGYINVPVMVQYMFDNGFRLQAGPQVGFLINAKSERPVIGEIDVKDAFKTVDFGVGAGLGYVHPASGFGVDARYNLGLSDITDDASKLTNRGFQLGVFYLFNHKN